MTKEIQEFPLVLIHAYLTDHTLWDGVKELLDKRIEVFTPDLPGFGETPVLTAAASMDAYADWLAAFLASRGVQRAVVVGMSMGGYVALAFAERHREMLAGLGLISTQALADSPAMRRLRGVIMASVLKHGPQEAANALLPKLFSAQKQSDPALVRLATENARRSSAEGICWALKAMAQRPDQMALLKTLDLPALVLHGTADASAPLEGAREMASLLPEARFIELSNAGHATPWEEPAAVANALADLMSRAKF